jgi:hypothetical protein
MSTLQPPGAPPVVPPNPVGFAGNGEHALPGNVTVTRNSPPKRAIVAPGVSINYEGRLYEGGDELLHGEGPVINALALQGQVIIMEHDATEAWNGTEGDKIRSAGRKHLAALADAEGLKVEHNHGFDKYSGKPDGEDAIEMDITNHAQARAMEQQLRGITQDEWEADRKAKKSGGAS